MQFRTDEDLIRLDKNPTLVNKAILLDVPITCYILKWNIDKKLVREEDGKKYKLSPWAIVEDEDGCYLIAYDHDTMCLVHHRVDRLEEIELVKAEKRQGLELIKDQDVYAHANRFFGIDGGQPEDVILRCENSYKEIIQKKFHVFCTLPVDSKHFEIKVPVYTGRLFYSWLFTQIPGIDIVSPKHVFDDYMAWLGERLERFMNKRS